MIQANQWSELKQSQLSGRDGSKGGREGSRKVRGNEGGGEQKVEVKERGGGRMCVIVEGRSSSAEGVSYSPA